MTPPPPSPPLALPRGSPSSSLSLSTLPLPSPLSSSRSHLPLLSSSPARGHHLPHQGRPPLPPHPAIEVRWLKNGRRATEGVFYGEELHNGDWTYQTQVMLEDTPQRRDVYACQVEHASLETPITVD
uniref:Ig-like domain-containing protein n=1 Tax=Varanus komodoensis TaxID=61221 RepID=A0A8D2L4W8_VARKO